MKPSISVLTLVHALVATALLFIGLGPWEILGLVGAAALVVTGVLMSAVGLGAMSNPFKAMDLIDYLPLLMTDTAPPTAVFYLILAVASSGWTSAAMAAFAVQSGWVWFTRKD